MMACGPEIQPAPDTPDTPGIENPENPGNQNPDNPAPDNPENPGNEDPDTPAAPEPEEPEESYYVEVAENYNDWSGDYLITYTSGSTVLVLNSHDETKG